MCGFSYGYDFLHYFENEIQAFKNHNPSKTRKLPSNFFINLYSLTSFPVPNIASFFFINDTEPPFFFVGRRTVQDGV